MRCSWVNCSVCRSILHGDSLPIDSAAQLLGQVSIQRVGKRLNVGFAEGRWPATEDFPGSSTFFSRVAACQVGANVVPIVKRATRVERHCTFLDDLCGERNVSRDDEIAWFNFTADSIVSDIEA